MESKDKNRRGNEMQAAYNLCGDVPQSYVWTYTEATFCERIQDFARDFIPDIHSVTLEHDPDTGEILVLVWIDRRSKHLSDKSLESAANSAIRVRIPTASKELKEFTNRFCPKKQHRPIDAINDKNLAAFIVDPLKIIDVMFDRSGEAAFKEFGVRPPSAQIRVRPQFSRKGDDKYGKLEYIEITKSTLKKYGEKPKARRSFKH